MARFMLLAWMVAPMILVSLAEGSAEKAYPLVVSKDGKYFNEWVKVDVKKNTETFHVQETSSGKDAGDIIYNFDKKMTMIRFPELKACFLSKSIGNLLKPAEMLQLLRQLNTRADVKLTPRSQKKLKVIGKLKSRSDLTTEMADLCANLTIYRVTEGNVHQNDMVRMNDAVPQPSEDEGHVRSGRSPFWRRRRRRRSSRRRYVPQQRCYQDCSRPCGYICSGFYCYIACPPCRKVCY